MDKLQVQDITFTWLDGGVTHLDGGAAFGVVPKTLWSKTYPGNEKNQVRHQNDPIYFEIEGKKIMIEAGVGSNKLNPKQKENLGCTREGRLEESLQKLGVDPDEIDFILLTHMHFDHAGGLTKEENGSFYAAFKRAQIFVSVQEWEEMNNPTLRSQHSYWEINRRGIEKQVRTFKERVEIVPGVSMVRSGGHSHGHSIVAIERKGESLLHMGDLMPTHTHANPLWVAAFDDYPIDSISFKEEWVKEGIKKDAWFALYHDSKLRAVKYDARSKVRESVKANPYS